MPGFVELTVRIHQLADEVRRTTTLRPTFGDVCTNRSGCPSDLIGQGITPFT